MRTLFWIFLVFPYSEQQSNHPCDDPNVKPDTWKDDWLVAAKDAIFTAVNADDLNGNLSVPEFNRTQPGDIVANLAWNGGNPVTILCQDSAGNCEKIFSMPSLPNYQTEDTALKVVDDMDLDYDNVNVDIPKTVFLTFMLYPMTESIEKDCGYCAQQAHINTPLCKVLRVDLENINDMPPEFVPEPVQEINLIEGQDDENIASIIGLDNEF